MPTKYTRKQGSTRASWSEEDLLQAASAVRERRMGVNEAARYYNIPKSTLKRRLTTNNLTKGTCGPSSVLGIENERKIATHIKKLQASGFSPTRETVRSMAYKLAQQLNLKTNFNRQTQKAGYDWLQSFLDRNTTLAVRKSEGVSKNRALGMNREATKQYFDLLGNVLLENDMMEKPGNIFNVDETGLQLNNRPGEVIAAKGSKVVTSITSGERGETVTVVSCFSAEGNYLPPYCIFKGKNKKAEYGDGMPPGSTVAMNAKSAYINSDLFLDWLKNQFVPRKLAGKVLLILDGHSSHCSSIEMLQYAEQNDIILLSLPSHTSHYLQPLDRSFFKSLKSYYYSACNTFMLNNPSRQITRLTFGKLLSDAWSKAATVENAISGFKRCGIVPFDIGAIPDYCFVSQADGDQSDMGRPTPEVPGSSNECLVNQTESAMPSTSHPVEDCVEPEDENPTPTKTLNKISPIPVLKKKKTVRGLQASVSKILNSGDNLKSIAQAKEKKMDAQKLKEEKKRKRSLKALFTTKKTSGEKGVVYEDSSEEISEWDENLCVGCLDDYHSTTSKADWVKCEKCARWYHENCTKFGCLCDFCGKVEKKQKRMKLIRSIEQEKP